MILEFETLNSVQRLAVEWNGSPLLVLAGPGSGKTRVLTMRVAKLILESPEKRFRVLGLTFTNKAATEMRQRVEQWVPECQERVLLTTFHSFCADILRQHGSHFGIRPDFTILSQDSDRESVLRDALAAINGPEFDIDQRDIALLPLIESLLASAIPESEVILRFPNQEFARKMTALYSEYRKQLILDNCLDFASLLFVAYELLIQKPAVAKQIRTIYRHVCVDEFQDTNRVQYLILKTIMAEDPSDLFVVADDDQIIYQWNGASPERLRSLQEDFEMDVVQLPANYRCPPEVISLANALIQNNLNRPANKEPLYAMKKRGSSRDVRVESFATFDEELEWVADDILEHHSTSTGDCVILARTKRALENAVAVLQRKGVAASLAIRKDEFTSAPFRWLHAILRLANARSDREQLRRACKAFFELEGTDLDVREVEANSARAEGDFLRSWWEIATGGFIAANTLKFLQNGERMIVDRLDVLGFVHASLAWFSEQEQKLGSVNDEGFVDFRDEKAIWRELERRIIEKYGRDDLTLHVYLQELDLHEKAVPIPEDAVRCLTIHTSKGMEFCHVYLIGLVEGQLPSFQSIEKGDGSRELQEERRNCFVAITRAQETLTLTYAREYFGWPKNPSRFLVEMGLT